MGDTNIWEINIDYCTRVVVVAKCRETKLMMSSIVPAEETGDEYPARRMRAFSNEFCYEHWDGVLNLIRSQRFWIWRTRSASCRHRRGR